MSQKTFFLKIQEIRDRKAYGTNDFGAPIAVPMSVSPYKGAPPKVGETWLIENNSGVWRFAGIINPPDPPVITGERIGGTALDNLLAQLNTTGLIVDETTKGTVPVNAVDVTTTTSPTTPPAGATGFWAPEVHNYVISGPQGTPSGALYYIPAFPVTVPKGQKLNFIRFVTRLRVDSMTVTVKHQNTAIGGLTGITVNSTQKAYAPSSPVALADLDEIQPVVTAVTGNPDGSYMMAEFSRYIPL